MTLGRTSSGAIKIKTDSPGLRAVECGCCGESCGCASVSNNLTAFIEAATIVTVNGDSAAWDGLSSIIQKGFGQLSWSIRYNSGQICIVGDTGDNTVTLGEGCLFVAGPGIQINGNSFVASHAFVDMQISMNIIFS